MTEPANPQADQSTELGSSARNGGVNITDANVVAHGDIVGRDKIVSVTITDAQQYDVRGLANPYLGLQSFTYADHAKYAGREKLIIETVAHLTAQVEKRWPQAVIMEEPSPLSIATSAETSSTIQEARHGQRLNLRLGTRAS